MGDYRALRVKKGTQHKEEQEVMPRDSRMSLLHDKPRRSTKAVSTGYLGGLPSGRNGILHQFREGREEEGIYHLDFSHLPLVKCYPRSTNSSTFLGC